MLLVDQSRLSRRLTSLKDDSWWRVLSLFGAASSTAEADCIRDSGDEICDGDSNGREVEFFEVGGFLFYAFAIGVFARELIPTETASCAHSRGVEVVNQNSAFDASPGRNGRVGGSMSCSFELFV